MTSTALDDWARTAAKAIMAGALNPTIRLGLYRDSHRIEAVELSGTLGPRSYCAHDGIRINPVRGGYRHDLTEVRALELAR